MQIVQLCSDNAQLLYTVAEDVFDYAIDPSQVEAFLSCPRHMMMLAVEDGIVIGMASAVEYFHPDKPPQLWINEIGVTPQKQSQGIGRRLMEALIAIGKDRGCAYAWVGTECDNIPAQRCFSAVANVEEPQEFLLYEWELSDGHTGTASP